MKTDTFSIRIAKEMKTEIDSLCDGIGCTRNDWIKDTLKDKLREEKGLDQEAKEETIAKEEAIAIKEEAIAPKEAVAPKETIAEVTNVRIVQEPLDNSKKPIVNLVSFNGQLLPFSKRYEI